MYSLLSHPTLTFRSFSSKDIGLGRQAGRQVGRQAGMAWHSMKFLHSNKHRGYIRYIVASGSNLVFFWVFFLSFLVFFLLLFCFFLFCLFLSLPIPSLPFHIIPYIN